MVPADDEHKSANEAEKNSSTQRNFFKKLKLRDRDKKDADEPARLTTLPKCLMHWLTPVWIAAAGFFIALAFAVHWRGEFHWPSAEAMKLCATIAGAGFAFSAWQQRSHDNVVNAKQAQATAEREDYWKRREHIFQLLGSKNPGLRLGAVALLAELADSAHHGTFLNKTEKQQLQRHIIDTLCLQLRHEGLEQKEDGNRDEHREIQKAIIDTLLRRINKHANTDQQADWSQSTIRITSCQIHTTVKIDTIKTDATLDFSETHFHKTFTIENSSIKYIRWQSAKFHQQLLVGDDTNTVQIQIDNIPQNSRYALFNNTCFTSNSGLIFFAIIPKQATQPKTLIRNCSFFHETCLCPSNCPCRRGSSSERCQCLARNHCKCSTKCVNAEVAIWDIRLANDAARNKVNIIFDNCRFDKFSIKLSHAHTSTTIYQSQFSHGLFIELKDHIEENTKIAYPDHPTKLLSIELCAFILPITEPCINLKVLTSETISIPIEFLNNSILTPYTPDPRIQDIVFNTYPNSPVSGYLSPLVCERDTKNPELLHFKHTLSIDNNEICPPWMTGRIQSASQGY